jgi:hypothetical protein
MMLWLLGCFSFVRSYSEKSGIKVAPKAVLPLVRAFECMAKQCEGSESIKMPRARGHVPGA